MAAVVDLDRLIQEVDARTEDWVNEGITVGRATWREGANVESDATRWPYRLKIDRAAVIQPWSFGVRFWRAGQQAGIIVYDGGWADFDFCSGWVPPHSPGGTGNSHMREGDEPIFECPEVHDLQSFVALIERMKALFDATRGAPGR